MKHHLLCVSLLIGLAASGRAQDSPNIDRRAQQLLRAACQYLGQASFFSLNAEVWREHVNDEGEKLQFTRLMDMEVRRPDRLHAEIHSTHSERGFWYDGKSLAVLDRKRNFYSTAAMPATLDEALDTAHDQFGIDLPIVDLAVSDPFKNATAKVITGRYFGLAPAMGFNCHHLAFTQENIDWQVWIQDGPQPLIRKFIITHKNEPGAPEFTALIRQWNLNDRIADSDFAFDPPDGALKVQMRNEPAPGPEGGTLAPTGVTQPREK